MRQTQEQPSNRYVLGDWGTSRLRLMLMDGDTVADRRDGPGIGVLTNTPADTLTDLIAPWTRDRPLDVLLSGMAGSRNGLFEVPYMRLPVDVTGWSEATVSRPMCGANITIAAGLRTGDQPGAADVMRGEETQIFGALRIEPRLATGNHLFVLPGTHSKWAVVENGSIVRFRTAMSGELYAVLRDHSILFKASNQAGHASDVEIGFDAGSQRLLQSEGLLADIFGTRVAQLLENRSAEWGRGYLSALLIGHEIASLSVTYGRTANSVHIVGDPALTASYARLFAARGTPAQVLDGTPCSLAGLRYLRECMST